MLKEWNSKRQLSLFVALALSAGGGGLLSDFQYAYAADVTGGNVVVDAGHPAPSPAAGNAHDIPGATDNRNVTGNKLTVDAVGTYGISIFGGYTAGTGNATGNTVEFTNGAYVNNAGTKWVYGGWSNQGNATNNTVIFNNAGTLGTNYGYFFGGFSNNASADKTTGNTLIIKNKNNQALVI